MVSRRIPVECHIDGAYLYILVNRFILPFMCVIPGRKAPGLTGKGVGAV